MKGLFVEYCEISAFRCFFDCDKSILMPAANNREELFACQKEFIKLCIERNFRYANRLQLPVWDIDKEK